MKLGTLPASLLLQSPQWFRRRLRRVAMNATTVSVLGEGSRTWVRFLYRGWSKVYDTTIDWDPAYRENLERLAADILRTDDAVLEVGIGTGVVAEIMAPRVEHYIGIDYSGAMLAKAVQKMANQRLENVRVQWGDARALPFDSNRFDVVVSSFVLPHFARSERGPLVTEMTRVLKPEGRLALFLAQGEHAPVFSTRTELESFLAEARLEVISIEDRDDIYRVITASKPK